MGGLLRACVRVHLVVAFRRTRQIRLTLAKKDYVRALIQSRKINRKVLLDEDMQDIKARTVIRLRFHGYRSHEAIK